jgi:PEGA domain
LKGSLSRRAWLALILLIGVLASSSRLCAETDPARLERAKALFREGNALLTAGDPERALERFLQSREAMASGKNTANAAICLERLGRYDEALDMYEELLARFAKDLDEQDRQNLAPIMANLRGRLASIDISSNVEGLVIVDGKARGRLPRTTALRVLAGKRLIRVVHEGYHAFELVLEVAPGAGVTVDASLEPLNGSGALRVEPSGRASAQLLIDGKAVGALPWEGTLPSGEHLLQAVGADVGSRPQTVLVLERKTLLVRLSTHKLGPVVRIEAWPRSAPLVLDGARLRSGAWSGRLPLGTHLVSAEERGYFRKQLQFVQVSETAARTLQLRLDRDPKSTRWPQPARLLVGARLLAGLVHAPTLKSDAEKGCPTACANDSSATGGKLEAALELLHPRGFGVEVAAGYQFANQAFVRAVTTKTALTYALWQRQALGGAYARIAGVAELPLRWGFSLRSSAGFGLAWMAYEASASGVAWTTGEQAEVQVFGYQRMAKREPFGTATLHVQRAFGQLALGLGLSGWFVPTAGPRYPALQLQVDPRGCNAGSPSAVHCAPLTTLAGERAHGPFAAVVGELAARYRF